jgi:hypothetical protein
LSSIFIYSIFSGIALNGFIYLFWIFFATMIRIGILFAFGETPDSILLNNPDSICSTGNIIPFANITYGSYIYLFSFFYICMPMFISNNINYYMLLFFIIYFIFDLLIKLSNNCIPSQRALSFLIGDCIGGIGLGAAISSLMYSSSLQKYLFINTAGSNKEVCSMASKQTFKCSVYKNGELVKSSKV